MKRTQFIRELVRADCSLKRHGKKHDIYINPKNGKKSPVPRHSEIKETLCALIANNSESRETKSVSLRPVFRA